MDFKLSEEQEAMREMAKNFAEKKIAPAMEEDEKEHRFRREIVKEMARLGFFGCISPEKYGGNESGGPGLLLHYHPRWLGGNGGFHERTRTLRQNSQGV